MNNKLLTILFCLFTAISITTTAQTYSGGSGTEQDPYLISNKVDMEALASAVNIPANTNYSTNKYFLLTQDIADITTIIGSNDNSSGSSTCRFQGVFDGGGHSITVNINTTSQHVGVFGYANFAVIKNLCVKGSISDNIAYYVGGICGFAYSSTINNCYNLAPITVTSYQHVGGICGYASNTNIMNCHNTGNISATVGTTSSSSCNSGGICGYFTGGSSYKISNCISTNQSIIGKNSNNSIAIGRIVGYLWSGMITNCYANASMQLNGATVTSQNATSKDGKDLFGSTEILNVLGMLNSKYLTYGDVVNVNEDNIPITFQVSDNRIVEINENILTAKKAGTLIITANYNWEDNDYQFGIAQTVNKKNLLIQADTITSIYGDIPQFTCKYKGFVNDETESFLTKLPSFSCSGTAISNVGNYTITPSGAEAENYTFTYKTGTLQIVKRDLRVIPDNLSRFYGDYNPAFTFQYTSFVNGDTPSNISIKPTATTTAVNTSPVGNYPITCSGGSATNYNLICGTAGTLTVTKAPLTVTANSASRYWGVENPTFTLTYTGFKNYENQSVLTELPQLSCSAVRLSPSGQYPIVVTGGSSQNYDITCVNGTLTVNKSLQAATVSLNFSNLNLVSGMGNLLTLSLEQEDPVLSFQTDITLPSFVSVDLNNVTLSNRCTNAHILSAIKVAGYNNTYRFLIYSPTNVPIAGNTGELLTIPLIFDWTSAPSNYSSYTTSASASLAVFYISETDKPEKSISTSYATFYIYRMGDVNINGTVTVSDIVAEVDYILGKNPQPFLFEAGDMNKNGVITILDLTQLVNVILTQPAYSSSLRSSANSDYQLTFSDLHLNYANGEKTGNIILSLSNTNPVIAMNWDLVLPDSVSIDTENIGFMGNRANQNTHTIAVNKLDNGNIYRFIIYSSQNKEIAGNSGDLLSIPIRLGENMTLGNYPVHAQAANLIYVENSEQNEVTPACKDAVLAISDTENTGTGVIETQHTSSLQVYPNPAKHYLFIKSDEPVKKLEIYNQSGVRVLLNENVKEKLDVSGLANGVYLAKIYVDGMSVNKKIVIKK